jgi:hypothetical protein
LGLTAPEEQSAIVFTGVFVIVWCGAAVVTLNAKLLGGRMSVFITVANVATAAFFSQFVYWDIASFHW